MLLLLVRHAEAENRDANRWPDDSLRPLVGRGRKRHRRICRRLRRRGIVPDLLLASPWTRAWESALILSDEVGCSEPVACDALAGPPDLARLAAAVGQPDPDAVIGMMGHEPWLSELSSLLLAGEQAQVAIDLPKSGVLAIRTDLLAPGAGTLIFLWRPRGKEQE